MSEQLGSCDLGNATYEMAATAWKLINIASSMKRQGGRSDDDAYFAVSVRSAETAYKNLPSGVRDAFFIRYMLAIYCVKVERDLYACIVDCCSNCCKDIRYIKSLYTIRSRANHKHAFLNQVQVHEKSVSVLPVLHPCKHGLSRCPMLRNSYMLLVVSSL